MKVRASRGVFLGTRCEVSWMDRDDSDDPLTDKHERNREQRVAEIKRWVAYIQDNPPKYGANNLTRS